MFGQRITTNGVKGMTGKLVEEKAVIELDDFGDAIEQEALIPEPAEPLERKVRQKGSSATKNKKEGYSIPKNVSKGDTIYFRINANGTLTQGWYLDKNENEIVNGTLEAATSRGIKCSIEHIADVNPESGDISSGGLRCKSVFGWFKMVEQKDNTGAVIGNEEFNLSGGRWGFSFDRSAGISFKKNLDILREDVFSSPDDCVKAMKTFIHNETLRNRKRELYI